MSASSPKAPGDRFKLRWDVLLFVTFLLSCAPSATGTPVHEWVSLAVIPILLVHLASNWNWIVDVSRRTLRRLPGEIRFNHILDLLLFGSMALLMLSGILISESALPALGIPRRTDLFWTRLHNTTANIFPSLIGVHLAMHARWILARLRRKPATPVVTEPTP